MIETYRGVAHPWLCDALGHLNTRHYLAMFDDALHHYMHLCGFRHSSGAANCGFADVSIKMSFGAEVAPASLIVVSSETVKVGHTSLTSRHTMTDAETGALRATCEVVSVHLDLAERRPTPLPQSLIEGAASYFAELGAFQQ